MNDVVAGDILREARGWGIGVDALRRVNIPVRPAANSPIRAGLLHRHRVVRIPREIGTQPRHHDMTVSIGGYPREHVRFAECVALIHADWRSPPRAP